MSDEGAAEKACGHTDPDEASARLTRPRDVLADQGPGRVDTSGHQDGAGPPGRDVHTGVGGRAQQVDALWHADAETEQSRSHHGARGRVRAGKHDQHARHRGRLERGPGAQAPKHRTADAGPRTQQNGAEKKRRNRPNRETSHPRRAQPGDDQCKEPLRAAARNRSQACALGSPAAASALPASADRRLFMATPAGTLRGSAGHRGRSPTQRATPRRCAPMAGWAARRRVTRLAPRRACRCE